MRSLRFRLVLLLIALPLLTQPALAASAERFADAYRALQAGRQLELAELERELADYPLTPYLEYAWLSRNLAQAEPERVERFLSSQASLPVSGLLRQRYLEHLGGIGDWERYQAFYRPTASTSLRCYRLEAERALRPESQAWIADAHAQWEQGRLSGSACQGLQDALFERKLLDEGDAWQRVVSLMQRGAVSGAEALRQRLSPENAKWLASWIQVHRQPSRLDEFRQRGEEASLIAAYGLRRLARVDVDRALALLERLQQLFTPLQRAELRRDIVLQAAYSQEPAALAMLDALPDEVVNDTVRLWRARLALRTQDWPRLLKAISALPPRQRAEAQWRYWRGHALEAVGEREAARELLTSLARERNYYGFMAADRLNLPYSMDYSPSRFGDSELAEVRADPRVKRAREFFRLGLLEEARREWHAAVASFEPGLKARAAALALAWGWYDRAIVTANSAGLHDALDLRFPLPYREQVEAYSRRHRLAPQVTYAILRKESAFRPDAVSPVGALGLMQVMPETGRHMARGLKVRLPSRRTLLEVDTNLELGSAYLRAMLDRYSGNLVLAAAAYNAGPERVGDWLSRNAGLPPAIWIEAITYYETRDYVKSVLAFATVFDWQLNGQAGRLSDYLAPVRELSDSGG